MRNLKANNREEEISRATSQKCARKIVNYKIWRDDDKNYVCGNERYLGKNCRSDYSCIVYIYEHITRGSDLVYGFDKAEIGLPVVIGALEQPSYVA